MSAAERKLPEDPVPGGTVAVLPQGAEDPPPGVKTMAIVRWALVGLMGIAAAAAWLHAVRPASGATAKHAEALFHCPMHPSVVQDQAGDCPICGMSLVAVAAREPEAIPAGAGVAGLAPVWIEPERLQLIGVRTAQVARRHLAPQLRTVGFVVAD